MSNRKLTVQHQKTYLSNPDKCPFCGSEDLRAGYSDFTYTTCERKIECKSCKEEFVEYFTMINIYRENEVPNIEVVKEDHILVSMQYLTKEDELWSDENIYEKYNI